MPNRMKAKLLAGEPAFGVSLMIPSPPLVEMVGRLGFDWVLLDCEHGSLTPDSVEIMAMAAAASGLTSIARPLANRPELILQLMDRGVDGVQVPHVNTAAEAQQAVSAVKYYPLGERGLAAGTRPANYGFGLPMADYVRQANDDSLVCVQIEERAALDNLAEIVAVAGVDVCFVGPSDLSQSLGFPGQPDAPPVRAAMDAAFATIVGAGKVAGSAGGGAATARYLQQGVRYLYTHLTTLLAAGSAAYRASWTSD